MVSPFRFRCAGCGQTTDFLDTDLHGEGGEFKTREGAEIGCAAYRGEGQPTPAACPACRGQVVGGVVTVTYHDERVEDWDADPAFPLADFFNWFRLDCTCRRCGRAAAHHPAPDGACLPEHDGQAFACDQPALAGAAEPVLW